MMDVDQEKGVLTTLLWLDLSWDDDYLRWARARFQGLECSSTSTNWVYKYLEFIGSSLTRYTVIYEDNNNHFLQLSIIN